MPNMYIPENIVNVLHNLDCETVARKFGINIVKHQAHCFMHEDKHPSLAFKNNCWKCFACDKGGDAISLIKEMFNLSFQESCIILCEQFNIILPNSVKSEFDNMKFSKLRLTRQIKTEDNSLVFDNEVATSIVEFLTLDKLGKKFLLKERRLSPDIIKIMNIKSIENSNILKDMLLSHFDKQRLIKCKVLNESNNSLTINIPSIVIPYYDINNNLVALQTRYIGTRDNIPRFKLICNSSIKLYNLSIISRLNYGDQLFIMEGITDCLAMLSSGKNAIAIQSATSIPEMELDKLSCFSLFMVPDKDEAGRKAYNRLYQFFLRYGNQLTRIDLPQNIKDYSEYYTKIHSKNK